MMERYLNRWFWKTITLALIILAGIGQASAQVNYAKAADSLGIYYPYRGQFFLQDSDDSGAIQTVSITGAPTAVLPLAGQWTTSGTFASVGVYAPATSTFYLKYNTSSSGSADLIIQFGWAPDSAALPVAGDWTGKGYDSIGFFVPPTTGTAVFYLKNSNTGGNADLTLPVLTNTGALPPSDAQPIVGDWTGNGIDRVGFYSPSQGNFYLRMTNNPSQPNCVTSDAKGGFTFGGSGQPADGLMGKWLTISSTSSQALFYPGNNYFVGKYTLDIPPGYGDFDYVAPPQGMEAATPAIPVIGKWQPSRALSASQNTSPSSPAWMPGQIMYELRIDLFTNTQSSGTNAFVGATAMLPTLADLGITGIIVDPIENLGGTGWTGPSNFYANHQPGTLDPRLGSNADFTNFVTQAHALGIKVYVDIVQHGVWPDSPFVSGTAAFPYDYFCRNSNGTIVVNIYGADELDFTSPGLQAWWTNNIGIAWVSQFGIDGFRMDLEPEIASYPLWNQFKAQVLASTGKQIVLIPELPQVPRAYTYDTTQNDFMISGSAGTLINQATSGTAGNIVDVVKSCPENFYTCGLSSHDSTVYGAQGRISRFGYGMLLSPFVPRWFMGEEFNATPSFVISGSNNPLYMSQLNWNQQSTNIAFYNEVKQLIRSRKSFASVIEPTGAPLSLANIAKVATYSGVDLPPYTMWSGSNSITVLASNLSATGTASAVVPISRIGLGGYPYFQVENLLTDSMSIHPQADILSGLSFPITQGGIVPLLVTGVNKTQLDQLFDNFNYVATDITDQTSVTGISTWSTQYSQNSSISANGTQAVVSTNGGTPGAGTAVANYPFTLSANTLYTLTGTFAFTGTTGADCWGAIGFSTLTGGGNNSGNIQGPWMLIRPQSSPTASGGVAGFYGDASHSAGSWSALASCYPNVAATITLNTQTNLVQYYIQGVLQGSVTVSAPQINYLFFQSFQTGNVMNLNSVHLTVQPTSISPAITTQPASQTIDEGQSANYSVVAAGVPTPACQWQRMPAGTGTWTNMTNVSGTYGGTSTPALTVSNATPEMTGDQFRCVANNGILSSATSSAATLTVQLGYTVWETNYFGSQSGNTSISGPSAIPQNDGIPNVIKYLCDINPAMPMTTASRAALPTIGVVTISGTQYGTLTYRQNQATPGLTFSVQTSSDLKAWTTITSYMIHPSGTDSATGDPIQQIQLNTNGGQKMFLRLNAIVQ